MKGIGECEGGVVSVKGEWWCEGTGGVLGESRLKYFVMRESGMMYYTVRCGGGVILAVPIPAQCLSRLRKPKEGLELINHAIKLDPKMPVARFNKAVALTATGQLEVREEGGENTVVLTVCGGKVYCVVVG